MLPHEERTEIGEKGINLSGKPSISVLRKVPYDDRQLLRRTKGTNSDKIQE